MTERINVQQVAWLVESEPDGLWWDGRFVSRGIDPRFFTRDPNEAIRFARREDAEKVASSSSALKATEHIWLASQPQQAAQGWVCAKCGTDRCKAPCPLGYSAALTGQCPMTGTAAAQPQQATAGPVLTDDEIVSALKSCEQEDHAQAGWVWRQRVKWCRAIEAAVIAKLGGAA